MCASSIVDDRNPVSITVCISFSESRSLLTYEYRTTTLLKYYPSQPPVALLLLLHVCIYVYCVFVSMLHGMTSCCLYSLVVSCCQNNQNNKITIIKASMNAPYTYDFVPPILSLQYPARINFNGLPFSRCARAI